MAEDSVTKDATPADTKSVTAAPAAAQPTGAEGPKSAEPATETTALAPQAATEEKGTLGGTGIGAGTLTTKPKITSEEIQKVEFCRRYLTEIAKEKSASKGTLVHALKINTTLGTYFAF